MPQLRTFGRCVVTGDVTPDRAEFAAAFPRHGLADADHDPGCNRHRPHFGGCVGVSPMVRIYDGPDPDRNRLLAVVPAGQSISLDYVGTIYCVWDPDTTRPTRTEVRNERGNFEGFEPRECGEHDSTGDRAWCVHCEEWCHPDRPCVRCAVLPVL